MLSHTHTLLSHTAAAVLISPSPPYTPPCLQTLSTPPLCVTPLPLPSPFFSHNSPSEHFAWLSSLLFLKNNAALGTLPLLTLSIHRFLSCCCFFFPVSLPTFPFTLSSALLSLSSSVTPPFPPSPSGLEEDYVKQGSDPSMCHYLVPQVPTKGQASPFLPPSLIHSHVPPTFSSEAVCAEAMDIVSSTVSSAVISLNSMLKFIWFDWFCCVLYIISRFSLFAGARRGGEVLQVLQFLATSNKYAY